MYIRQHFYLSLLSLTFIINYQNIIKQSIKLINIFCPFNHSYTPTQPSFMEKQQKTPSTPNTPKQDHAFLVSLPTLYHLQGNPSTIIQVIGADGIQGQKFVKKKIIINQQNKQYAYNQRTMMQIINSDYVLKLLHWEQLNYQIPKKLALYMHFCQNGDLRQYLSQQNPSIAQRIQLFIDVLYAMRFLHEKFIIHRDMKLENIFVTENGQIKIADLGYASQTASLAFSIIGTFAYQAPEVFLELKGGYSEKADVWSVGYLGFQILNKPLPEEVKKDILIRDPFMPSSVLREKVKNFQGSRQTEYMKIFEQNPLVFVPNIPKSLKFLLGEMLVARPQKRISFREIYEGKYFTDLRKQLQENKQFGPERVQKFKNLHALINEYPKIYQSLKAKQKRLTKHQELHNYLYYRLYEPLTQKLYSSQSSKIPLQKANSMRILLFLAMRKMKTIYQQVKGEDFFVLKKKLQSFDKTVSKKYMQVKNSVQAYLRNQGQKGIQENKELLDEDYFIKLMKMHAKDIKINASSIIE